MTVEPNPITPAPQLLMEFPPGNPDEGSKSAVATNLSKEAKQRYLITEIKKLVEGCEDFIGLVPGANGVPEILVSPNLKHDRWAILGDAHGNFLQYFSDRNPGVNGSSCASVCPNSKVQKQEPPTDSRVPSGSISYPFQRPVKRHRSRTVTTTNHPSNPRGQTDRRMRLVCEAPASQIRVDDREKLAQWFQEAFLTLQQVACRLVAKVWIKRIHPKKQSTHPYNGQMPRGEPADSDRTRPPYWPPDVIHREPDHIGREDRTHLLVHLIMATPQPVITNPPSDAHNMQFVTAQDLFECLETKRSELREDRWEIIQQIIRAREMQEQYEAGEIDGETLVFLSDYSDGSRLTPHDSEPEVLGQDGPGQGISSDASEEVGDESELTPVSSTRPSPTEQVPLEGRLHYHRVRSLGGAEGSNGRRPAPRRPRPSITGTRTASSIAPRAAQEFSTEMTMALPNGAGSDTIIHDPRASVGQGHAGSMMMVRMSPQLSTNSFDQELDNSSRPREMMHVLPHHGNRQNSLTMQPWMGMMPDIGPDAAEHLFGVSSHMATQPQDLGHPYFGHPSHEMGGPVPNGLISPIHFQDFGDGGRRNLPVRHMDTQSAGMMPPPELNMDMMSGPFYPL